MSGPHHFYLDDPTPDMFRVIVGRHGGRYRFEFPTLADAVDWTVRNEDSDEHYIAYIEGPDGLILYDHQDPFKGWQPPLEVTR